jgi:hypothetical protein
MQVKEANGRRRAYGLGTEKASMTFPGTPPLVVEYPEFM